MPNVTQKSSFSFFQPKVEKKLTLTSDDSIKRLNFILKYLLRQLWPMSNYFIDEIDKMLAYLSSQTFSSVFTTFEVFFQPPL